MDRWTPDNPPICLDGSPAAVRGGPVPYYHGEFWTSKQRQAHRLHEVPYRACFKPQLPRFFIEALTEPGGVVFDPFMGRGTTVLEAALMRRVPRGSDANPLSEMLVGPRLAPPTVEMVEGRLEQVPWDSFTDYERDDLLAFYHPHTLARIEGLRALLLGRLRSGEFDFIDDWIRMVVLTRLTGHSSGFLSVYTLPPNQAIPVWRQEALNEKRGQTPPYRDLREIVVRKTKALLSDGRPPATAFELNTWAADARPWLPEASVDLVVTSPPFLDVVNYAADNWLRNWFAGVCDDGLGLTQLRSVKDWTAFAHLVLMRLAAVVKPGGYVAYEVGEVRGGKVPLDQHVIEAAAHTGLRPVCVLVNEQAFTKTAAVWGVSGGKGTNTNRVVILRRA